VTAPLFIRVRSRPAGLALVVWCGIAIHKGAAQHCRSCQPCAWSHAIGAQL